MTAVRRRRERQRAGSAPKPPSAPQIRPRRKLPWRPVALVVAAALALGAGGFFANPLLQRWWTGRHFARARQMVASGQDVAAAAELAVVLRRDPSHRQARWALARLERRQGRIEHAFLDLVSYTELAPEDADGWIELADLHASIPQPAEAEAALTHALEIDPARPGLQRRRAELRLGLGRIRSALADAESAVRRDPSDVEAWVVLSRAVATMRGRGARDEAMRKAIAAAGPDPRLLSLSKEPVPREAPRPPAQPRAVGQTENWPGDLGVSAREFRSLIQQSNWSGAAALVRALRERYPGTMLGPWFAGILALGERQPERAEQALLEALAVSPRSHRAVTNLIPFWSRQHGPEGAGDRLVALAAQDPGFTYPLPIAARAYLEAAQPAKAEATVRKLFTLLPASPVPFREMADFFLAVDRASDAISSCEQGLAKFPGNADLELLLARAALQLGDRERAIAGYENALAARPDSEIAAAQLARLLAGARKDPASRSRALQLVRELEFDQPADADVLAAMGAVLLGGGGDPAQARPWLEAARQAAPQEPGVRYQLALAYARSGETALARKELGEALSSGRAFAEEADARRLARELGAVAQ
ncbi:MAG TPA: tetratricopeptide repeat protein [Myxococcales bacterium]|nr:tetratricopeptide repeat protein [Myxococcales bacterium]